MAYLFKKNGKPKYKADDTHGTNVMCANDDGSWSPGTDEDQKQIMLATSFGGDNLDSWEPVSDGQ